MLGPLKQFPLPATKSDCIYYWQILAAPFVAASPYVDMTLLESADWVGTIKKEDIGEWIDTMLLLILGGIPWQGYMQRILAIKNTKTAQRLSIVSMFGCMLMAIPPAFIGLTARYKFYYRITVKNI